MTAATLPRNVGVIKHALHGINRRSNTSNMTHRRRAADLSGKNRKTPLQSLSDRTRGGRNRPVFSFFQDNSGDETNVAGALRPYRLYGLIEQKAAVIVRLSPFQVFVEPACPHVTIISNGFAAPA
jgi:hypothetical protein